MTPALRDIERRVDALPEMVRAACARVERLIAAGDEQGADRAYNHMLVLKQRFDAVQRYIDDIRRKFP